MSWWRRLFRQRQLETELDAELRDHIDRQVADAVRAGESDTDARRQVRLRLGGFDQVKEECRDVRRPRALADAIADLRFAVRMLKRDRWFAAGAILALGLAMGLANTAFIFAHAVELRGMPVERPDRLVILTTTEGPVSYPDFDDWRKQSRVLNPLVAFSPASISLGGDGAPPEQYNGNHVSADTFGVLGVRPILGRDFSEADDSAGAEMVVIIGSTIWKNRYGGSPDVVGRRIVVNGTTPATIVGVMPDGFRFHEWIDVWIPLAQLPGPTRQNRAARLLFALGRLPDGVRVANVLADLEPVGERLAEIHPDTNTGVRPLPQPLAEAFNGTLTTRIRLMPLLAAALILLIASANVANLLLARATFRSREIAIRLALGAGRWRIVRQLLIESLLLSCLATTLAVGISWLWVQPSAQPLSKIAPYMRLIIDGRLLAFLGVLAFLITGLFGLAPALYAVRQGQSDALRDGGRTSGSRQARRWTHGLLVVQFALTLALLTAAGLAAQSVGKIYSMDADVDTSGVITMPVRLAGPKYAAPEQRLLFLEQLEARLRSVPGISGSTIANAPPFNGGARRVLLAVEGKAVSDPPPRIGAIVAEPGYFDMLGIPLMLGHRFSEADGTPGHDSVIVNRRFADRYIRENPIGIRLELRQPQEQSEPVTATIVGVSANIRQGQGDVEPIVYLPLRSLATANSALIVRGAGGSERVASAVREAVHEIDGDLALGAVRTLDELRMVARYGSANTASQFTAFGVVALTLTAVGLYAVMAYAVTRRTREIGIRMALGARPADVGWLFLRTSAWIIAGGLVLGIPASVAAGRLLQASIVDTLAGDLTTLLVVTGILVGVALMAAIVPARRATRVQPTVALRIE